jgi:hypothetical protein
MPDKALQDALRTVAQHILADKAANALEWEEYPEIGQDDWFALCQTLNDLAPFPPTAVYNAAYEYLEARATPDA